MASVLAPAFYNGSMARSFDVCILGAGIVGQTLALHLAAKNHKVALVTRHTQSDRVKHPDVRAYALSPISRALLVAVRCWPETPYCTAVLGIQAKTQDSASPGALVHFSSKAHETGALNWIVDVPVLEDLLADAVRFQPLIEMQNQSTPAPLTIICEGLNSQSRTAFGVEFDSTPYAQVAIAARVQGAWPHAQQAQQWFSDGEILALLPMNGAQSHSYGLVWSVSSERAKALLNMGDGDFCHALQASTGTAPGPFELVSQRMHWNLQAGSARRWCGQRVAQANEGTASHWVLVGDAAHSVHPLAGQGLNLGLGDAAELVRLLGERPYWRSVADMRLLRAYERARKAELALIGGSCDLLHQVFTLRAPSIQSLRDRGMQVFERSTSLKNWIAKRAMGVV